MSLTQEKRKVIEEALIDAFDRSSFERMLMHQTGKKLENITLAESFRDVVFKVVSEAIREEWLEKLICGAHEENKSNRKLQAVRNSLDEEHALSELESLLIRIIVYGHQLHNYQENVWFSLWSGEYEQLATYLCDLSYEEITKQFGLGEDLLKLSNLVSEIAQFDLWHNFDEFHKLVQKTIQDAQRIKDEFIKSGSLSTSSTIARGKIILLSEKLSALAENTQTLIDQVEWQKYQSYVTDIRLPLQSIAEQNIDSRNIELAAKLLSLSKELYVVELMEREYDGGAFLSNLTVQVTGLSERLHRIVATLKD